MQLCCTCFCEAVWLNRENVWVRALLGKLMLLRTFFKRVRKPNNWWSSRRWIQKPGVWSCKKTALGNIEIVCGRDLMDIGRTNHGGLCCISMLHSTTSIGLVSLQWILNGPSYLLTYMVLTSIGAFLYSSDTNGWALSSQSVLWTSEDFFDFVILTCAGVGFAGLGRKTVQRNDLWQHEASFGMSCRSSLALKSTCHVRRTWDAGAKQVRSSKSFNCVENSKKECLHRLQAVFVW